MSFNNIYDIDFDKLANLLTPPFLRKKRLIDWLIVLLSPLKDVNLRFNKFREDSIYKVTHNGQVYSLQAVLNDRYDDDLRRIRIVDSLDLDPLYIYPEGDNRPVYLETGYVYDNSILDEIDFDFIVVVPIEYMPVSQQNLNTFLIQMRGLINYYKLASKRYKIIFT